MNTMFSLSASGSILHDGAPFFPCGFYHVGWDFPSAARLAAVSMLGDSGFNCIHASLKNADDLSDYEQMLDLAAQKGVWVLTEFGPDGRTSTWENCAYGVEAFKDHPAVLGWSLADDLGSHAGPEQVKALHEKVKSVDPNHLTYLSVRGVYAGYEIKLPDSTAENLPERLARTFEDWDKAAPLCDLTAGQCYPIGQPGPLSQVFETFRGGFERVRPLNKPLLANLQFYRWYARWWTKNGGDELRYPTPAEARNMSFQALCAGARGMVNYVYGDSVTHLPDQTELWQEAQNISAEIQELAPFFLETEAQILSASTPEVLQAQWTMAGKTLQITVNTTDQQICGLAPLEVAYAVSSS
jgi:hypothetical protein